MAYLKYYLHQWPERCKRFVRHLISPFCKRGNSTPATGSFWIWLGDIPFLVADLLALPEVFQAALILLKPSIRPLTANERHCAQRVFKDAVDYDVIRIDNRARVGIHSKVIAYVTFNCINFKNTLSPEIFIHEMMHVWQFQKFGSMYLFRAMKAQMSHTVYDFGGIENLYHKMLAGKELLDFNFEQQAEIIETYYLSVEHPEKFATMEKQVLAYFASCLHDTYAKK
jgi:hypothetical protein